MSKFIQLDDAVIDLDRVVKILPKVDQYDHIRYLVVYFEDTKTVSIPVKNKDIYFELCKKVTSTNTNELETNSKITETINKDNEQLIHSMKNSLNCQTWNEWQCPYARDNDKDYILVKNNDKCPCDKWKLKE